MRFLALAAALLLAACTGNDYYQGPPSDHFDGTRFFNPDRPRPHGFGGFLRWRLGFGSGPARAQWPLQIPFAASPTVPAERVQGNALVVTAVGHATFLIQTQGLNILTDPVLSNNAGPTTWLGPVRVTQPGLTVGQLPPIDIIWVSHNHYDHLDLPTLAQLVARKQKTPPRILTPLGNDTIINRAIPAAKAEAYDWGDTVSIAPGITAILEPMQHWSARGLFDRQRALWAALVLQTPSGNIYFVGDSGYGKGTWFREHGLRYGGFRLGLFPIGAYEPRWFMEYSHMNPAEAVASMKDSSSSYAIGHHWGTFQLTDEEREQPLTDLATALAETNTPPHRFRALLPGEAWQVPAR